VHCLIFLQITCTPFSLSQEVDKRDGFRSSEIYASLIVRDSSSDVSNAQYALNDYPNREFYHSARPAPDLDLDILEDGTSDITLNSKYQIAARKNIYDDALGDAFFRMVGFASSSIYLATLGEDMIVRNLHYTLLVGFKGHREPLPSVDSCGVHSDDACLFWAANMGLKDSNETGSYRFNEVSLCAAAYGIGNLAEIQRARDGYKSDMIKWTRIPLGKFDVVSRPGRINYFMTYYAKAKFQIYVMTEGMVNCVDETLSIIYHDCPENTAYPHEPCVYETPHSICSIKLIGTTDNSEYTCEYFDNVLGVRKANIPSDPPFDPLEVDQQRVLKSDNIVALESTDLTHLLPSGVSYIINCYMQFKRPCTYLDGGWSELHVFGGCADGYTAITETGQERCVATNLCDGVGGPVVTTPYLPYYEISETVYEVDLELYRNHYQELATEFERRGFPRIATFTRGATGQCEVACLKIPDDANGTYYTNLPTKEAITAAENLCESSNEYGKTFSPHVDRKPVTACHDTLVEATPFTDAVCTCPEGHKFAEVMVDGVTQLNVTRCVECDRCDEGKIAKIQCGTAWRYYRKRTRDRIMLWPLVDANSEYSVKYNMSAIDQTFTYFNIDQVCGPCATCSGHVWTDCSGLTRECRPCNCSGNVTNDQICIVDDCQNTYSDNTVPRLLSDLQCDSGQWRNISRWADDDNRSYTTVEWKHLRCVDCVLSDANQNMFDLSTTSEKKIRCLNQINNQQIFTTGKRFPGCSGAEDSLPSCEDCPTLPDHAFWVYISAENESSIEDCEFACNEHYKKVWDDGQQSYVCSQCFEEDTDANRIRAIDPCETGYYRSSCRPHEATKCLRCSPRNCSKGEYIQQCVDGYDINRPAASVGMINQCVACDNNVMCETNQQYRNCSGYDTADVPHERCVNCTGQNIPDNSKQREDSCIAYCLPYFYPHANPDNPSEFTCEPCPQTDHGKQHYCCGDTEEDCGKTLEVSDECAKPGDERYPDNWVPSCACKPGWEPTEDGDYCKRCDNWKVSTNGTECINCPQGGTQGNRRIGADACEDCPRSYYRTSQASSNVCQPCVSGTDNRTGAEDCLSGSARCRNGERAKYVEGGQECGQCAAGAETFWTGTYDIFGIIE